MWRIVWVSAGYGYRSEMDQIFADREEADAECKRLNDQWSRLAFVKITNWAVEDATPDPLKDKTP